MLRFLLVVCAFWLIPAFGMQAQTLECKSHFGWFDPTICEDAELIELEKKWGDTFRRRQEFVISGDLSLIDEQLFWQQTRHKECPNNAEMVDKIISCLKSGYRSDIALLEKYPFSPFHAIEGTTLAYSPKFLPTHDIEFTLLPPEACAEGEFCKTEGLLSLYRTRNKNPYQSIIMPSLVFSIGPTPDLTTGARCTLRIMESASIDPAGCTIWYEGEEKIKVDSDFLKNRLQVNDYNFDGYADFIFQDFDDKYWFFLYNPEDGFFYHAPALTKLFDNGRSVEVDEKNKEIVASYDYREILDETYYKIEHNVPVAKRAFHRFREGDDVVEQEKILQEDGMWKIVKEERSSYW